MEIFYEVMVEDFLIDDLEVLDFVDMGYSRRIFLTMKRCPKWTFLKGTKPPVRTLLTQIEVGFQLDAHEKAVWLEKLGLKEFTETVSKNARICFIHFEGEASEIKPSGKIFLRKGARPLFLMKSIFQQLKLLQPRDTSATMTAPEIDTESLSETLTASETELIQMSITEKETDRPTISQKKKAVIDLSTSDFSTPRKARRNFRSMKKTVLGQKTKIKTSQQSVRRLRSKVTNLNSLINHLKSKSLVHEDCETLLRVSFLHSLC
ncbi:hypothetical protein JTB14_020606 [Gonioctena quinquepunctata]|nr:hypothetical protein JTB14_020606 [Gonioctena quinquepunctata]